jgi:hypothetical protein
MSSVCLVDTCIFSNVLDVPNRNQEREKVFEDFKSNVNSGFVFLLPMATIIETGNHIAQNGDGTIRRKTALHFVEQVKAAFNGTSPWKPCQFPQTGDILSWIDQFPDLAGHNKTSKKLKGKPEGTSFGDLSIIQEFHKACARFPMTEVFIWSLDSDLKMYHQLAKKL